MIWPVLTWCLRRISSVAGAATYPSLKVASAGCTTLMRGCRLEPPNAGGQFGHDPPCDGGVVVDGLRELAAHEAHGYQRRRCDDAGRAGTSVEQRHLAEEV